jgi:glycerate 2-kinase
MPSGVMTERFSTVVRFHPPAGGRPLTVAIAPDSFKGTLTAAEAARCIERGFRRVFGRLTVRRIPMADGGEGTVEAIVAATGGRPVIRKVSDPLGRPIRVVFGLSGDGRTAIIEMAAASGLPLLKPAERNPMLTSTRGTGEMIRHALDLKVRLILIGIGGSATVDGGVGMARALGARFLDREGRDLPEGGGGLRRLARIDARGLDPRLRRVTIEVACDVDNPLTGARGAARVYGPQKGATPAMVRQLDANLRRLARIVRRDVGADIERLRGAGAAGGLGGGLVAFAGARLRSGVEVVADTVRLKPRLRGCDLVITGEGRMDVQTVHGKTPVGVARVAKELGLPVIAICGSAGPGAEKVLSAGIDAYFAAAEKPLSESELGAGALRMLTDCAERVARWLKGRWVVPAAAQ